MTNKEFVNLCNSNNTTWFELYFDLMFVAYILVLGNLLKSISNDETTGSRWRHLWETNLLFFLGYCYIHITHACHAPAHSRLRCGGSRCRWLTWTHLNMYMARSVRPGFVSSPNFSRASLTLQLSAPGDGSIRPVRIERVHDGTSIRCGVSLSPCMLRPTVQFDCHDEIGKTTTVKDSLLVFVLRVLLFCTF